MCHLEAKPVRQKPFKKRKFRCSLKPADRQVLRALPQASSGQSFKRTGQVKRAAQEYFCVISPRGGEQGASVVTPVTREVKTSLEEGAPRAGHPPGLCRAPSPAGPQVGRGWSWFSLGSPGQEEPGG